MNEGRFCWRNYVRKKKLLDLLLFFNIAKYARSLTLMNILVQLLNSSSPATKHYAIYGPFTVSRPLKSMRMCCQESFRRTLEYHRVSETFALTGVVFTKGNFFFFFFFFWHISHANSTLECVLFWRLKCNLEKHSDPATKTKIFYLFSIS